MILFVYSLCGAEGHLKVLPAVAGTQAVIVKGFRKKIVNQGTESHAIAPAGGKVLNVHMLGEKTNQKSVAVSEN